MQIFLVGLVCRAPRTVVYVTYVEHLGLSAVDYGGLL